MTIGWVLSAIVSIIFFAGAYTQFTIDPRAAGVAPVSLPSWFHPMVALSLVAAGCLHLVPHQSFAALGTILMTGMIGGMIVMLLFQGNSLWWTRGILGVLPWLALYLRSDLFNDLMSFWR